MLREALWLNHIRWDSSSCSVVEDVPVPTTVASPASAVSAPPEGPAATTSGVDASSSCAACGPDMGCRREAYARVHTLANKQPRQRQQ
ncbi:unnamed protein product, partial [Laminaria digitata]